MAFEYKGREFTLLQAVERGIRKPVPDADYRRNNFLWHDRAATMLCAYTASEYILILKRSSEEIVTLAGKEYVVRSLPQDEDLLPYAIGIQDHLFTAYQPGEMGSRNASRIAHELGKVAPRDESGLLIATSPLATVIEAT